MKNDEIKTKLKELIVTKLDANIRMDDLTDDEASLFEGGVGLDSISIVNFIVVIEKYFGFRFEDEEVSMELFTNLNTLSAFIGQKLVVH
jgi:acyl carrier protein